MVTLIVQLCVQYTNAMLPVLFCGLHAFLMAVCVSTQEHAERPEVVQRLISDAQALVQQAQQLEVRLDKDVTKLQVRLNLSLAGAFVMAHLLLSCLCTAHLTAWSSSTSASDVKRGIRDAGTALRDVGNNLVDHRSERYGETSCGTLYHI